MVFFCDNYNSASTKRELNYIFHFCNKYQYCVCHSDSPNVGNNGMLCWNVGTCFPNNNGSEVHMSYLLLFERDFLAFFNVEVCRFPFTAYKNGGGAFLIH